MIDKDFGSSFSKICNGRPRFGVNIFKNCYYRPKFMDKHFQQFVMVSQNLMSTFSRIALGGQHFQESVMLFQNLESAFSRIFNCSQNLESTFSRICDGRPKLMLNIFKNFPIWTRFWDQPFQEFVYCDMILCVLSVL